MDGWKRGCHFVNNSLEWSPPILDSKPEWYYACSITQSRCTLYGHRVSLGWLSSILKSTGAGIVSHCIRWDPFSIFNHSLSDMRGDHTLYHHFIILEWHMWKKKGGKDKEEKVIHLLSLCKQLEPQPYPSPKVKAQINMKEFYKLIMHAWKLINMVMSIFC